ncbi:response regulator transcription factor [Panacibacter sp. DH6]|uniref:Response regulator transcription factor n=1 Tax=Panacibacter microcysteis TaxID=2793269 RepID=A0A931E7V6_9BACT|nr:response regulator transcription factor [Panacibacter microcysteis]MBG9375879.1 response regulator transcription factor [Panacibacter microcysteis]
MLFNNDHFKRFPHENNLHRTFTVALADDHVLIRNGLAGLINSFPDYQVLFQAVDGQDFIDKMSAATAPDVAILDINMPRKDGYETANWIRQHYPEVKILALSMYDNENYIIRMLKNGARGYVLKEAEPSELKMALDSLIHKGYHHSELVTGHLINTLNKFDEDPKTKNTLLLSDREIEFLQYVCTELSYKEIADKMYLSPRTIDGYRDSMFDKLNIKTRVGLALYAVKNGLVNLNKM